MTVCRYFFLGFVTNDIIIKLPVFIMITKNIGLYNFRKYF